MPIYEYRCADCGFQDEYLQKVSEPPMTVCPTCGKEAFRKLVSAAGFQLKGSGWYVTDFRNSGKTPAKSTPAEGAKAEGSSAQDGGESKAEPKTEPKTESKSEPKTESSTGKPAASACSAG